MRFRELERIILDDGWVLSDIRDSHSSVQTSFKVRESNHSQSQRRYSFASC